MRDGVPLPGVSPADVVGQLTHRVFGPLQPNRVRQVLDYHGLAGRRAGTRTEIAARLKVTNTSSRVGVIGRICMYSGRASRIE